MEDKLFKHLGVSYSELVKNVLECWNDSYYKIMVPGAPEQRLHVTTQPSGALTTVNDNSIVMYALMKMIGEKSNRPFSGEQVWGDDFYGLVNITPKLESAVDVIEFQENMATEAGQVLGTVADR